MEVLKEKHQRTLAAKVVLANLVVVFVEMGVLKEHRERYLQHGVTSAIALLQNEEWNAQRYLT